MRSNLKNPSLVITALLALALAGCGSDPVTECITGDQALAALRSVFPGIEPCGTDANDQTMIDACGPGGIVTEDSYTTRACAFKGGGSCGAPPTSDTTCNVLGEFTVRIYTKAGCDSKCFTPGNIMVENKHVSCQDANNPTPVPCENATPDSDA